MSDRALGATPLVLDFGDIGAGALGLVGGKGANLAWMAQAGLPVPPGFCVTTAAFRRFVGRDIEPLYAELEALDAGDVEGTRVTAARVRDVLGRLPVPLEVADAVTAAWRAWRGEPKASRADVEMIGARSAPGPDHAWAVRSSATAEDLPGASFAGQQDTYLNVRGERGLLDAVRNCWVSLFTDRAVLYRARNGFPHRAVALSVVVQRMVDPESSGILFTADPVSGSRTVASIDAGFGLGEALVGGLVDADLYKADKATGRVREVRVGDKAFAIRARPGGGTERVPLPETTRRERVLTDAQVAELCGVARRIERAAGVPQDIEWCYERGVLYVVQARPITTLYPLPEPPPLDGLHAYVSFGHIQMMPEAMPPLALDTWMHLLPFARGSLTGRAVDRPARPRAAAIAGGRLYIDVTAPLRIPPLRALLLGIFAAGYPQIPDALRPLLGRLGPDRWPSIAGAKAVLRLLGPALPRVAAALVVWPVEQLAPRADAAVARILDGLGRLDSPRALRDRLGVLFPSVPTVAPPIAAGLLARRLLMALGVPEPELQPVLRALPHNGTTEMDLALADLGDRVRPHAALAESLARAGLAGAAGHPEAKPFLEGFRAFQARYGMRGAGEIDLSRPRWRDEPRMLLSVILGGLTGGEAGAHRRRHAAMAADAEAGIDRIVRETPWWRRVVVRRLLRVMRAGLGLREHPKYLIVHVLERAREVATATGKALAARGVLARADDVWFLTWDELVAASDGPSALRATVAARREAFAHDQKRQPPLVVASDGEIPRASARADLPPNAIGGVGASAGVVEGPARVVLDPASEVLRAGEVLVAPFTDPGWTPLFTHAAGLATEVGGMMTHGSVIAREMGIPAVVGAGGVTTRIRTGDIVRVDGDRGYVEIVASAGEPAAGAAAAGAAMASPPTPNRDSGAPSPPPAGA
jgi:rifampicin phosphotransferase